MTLGRSARCTYRESFERYGSESPAAEDTLPPCTLLCQGCKSRGAGVIWEISATPMLSFPRRRGAEIQFASLWKCGRKEWDSRLHGNDCAFEGDVIPIDSSTPT